jgi:hypothetical protein
LQCSLQTNSFLKYIRIRLPNFPFKEKKYLSSFDTSLCICELEMYFPYCMWFSVWIIRGLKLILTICYLHLEAQWVNRTLDWQNPTWSQCLFIYFIEYSQIGYFLCMGKQLIIGSGYKCHRHWEGNTGSVVLVQDGRSCSIEWWAHFVISFKTWYDSIDMVCLVGISSQSWS